ncbi:energy transducer TonB [Luteimonas aquatica]|uniref:energy transducer TonB n=1 Tax=Luteimonas aquatica TaxID=450364 RepID=UPI001F5A7DCE|nr:energy transducer TonB [Luteimonas aquatica]
MPSSTARRRHAQRAAWLALIACLGVSLACPARDRRPPLPGSGDYGASVDIASKNANPPVYPAEARQAGIEGTVVIIVRVDRDGKFLRAFVERSSKNRQLDQAALEAARHWRYYPTIINGEHQRGRIRIPVDFNLE